MLLLEVSSPRPPRPRWRSQRPRAIDDAPPDLGVPIAQARWGGLGGRSAAEDGGGGFLASRGMSFSSGEESRPGAVAAQAIEAQPSFGQIKPTGGHGARAPPTRGDVLAHLGGLTQAARLSRRRHGSPSAQISGRHDPRRLTQATPLPSDRAAVSSGASGDSSDASTPPRTVKPTDPTVHPTDSHPREEGGRSQLTLCPAVGE
jgi:hypothetical protein